MLIPVAKMIAETLKGVNDTLPAIEFDSAVTNIKRRGLLHVLWKVPLEAPQTKKKQRTRKDIGVSITSHRAAGKMYASRPQACKRK
jgi:hypothetical protein